MMEILKVSDHRRVAVATEILKEDQEQTKNEKYLDSEDESSDEDRPLTDLELKELLDSVRTLLFDLVKYALSTESSRIIVYARYSVRSRTNYSNGLHE